MIDVNSERVRKGQERPLGILGDPDVELEEGLVSLINGVFPKVSIDVMAAFPLGSEGSRQLRNNNLVKSIKESASCVCGGGDTVGAGGGWTGGDNNSHFIPTLNPDNLGNGEAAHPQAAGQLGVADAVKVTHDQCVYHHRAIWSRRRGGGDNCGCRGRRYGDGGGRGQSQQDARKHSVGTGGGLQTRGRTLGETKNVAATVFRDETYEVCK